MAKTNPIQPIVDLETAFAEAFDLIIEENKVPYVDPTFRKLMRDLVEYIYEFGAENGRYPCWDEMIAGSSPVPEIKRQKYLRMGGNVWDRMMTLYPNPWMVLAERDRK